MIGSLAEKMCSLRASGEPGCTLILGAGASVESGCSTWFQLCEEYCNHRGIDVDPSPIKAFKDRMRADRASQIDAYTVFEKAFIGKTPSLGYEHLANLASQGFFRTIITTNFDCLLETAIAKFMSPEQFKVLVRGEISDQRIADFLTWGKPAVRVLKLHGDLISRLFLIQNYDMLQMETSLKDKLVDLVSQGAIIVGHAMQDLDLLGLFLSPTVGPVYYINPKPPKKNEVISGILESRGDSGALTGKAGGFDSFFSQLNLMVQRISVKDELVQRENIESSILKKQERGAGYINYSNLTEMVGEFVNKIMRRFGPSVIVFIDDPAAPGGMELKRLMTDRLNKSGVQVETICIKGKGVSRSYQRRVYSPMPSLSQPNDDHRILILDAITFSGNTLKLALQQMKEWFPDVVIRTGALIIDEQLSRTITSDRNHFLRDIIYHSLTDRHEIFFPWGVTQATSDCNRVFTGIEPQTKYPISVTKRPWGTVEVLAHQKHCSVRLLTIEADQCLSFQRHLCRDELFVSIDENIGLEVCAQDLGDVNDVSNSPDVKSLVLERGNHLLIPRGIWHRFKASKDRVVLLEISFGLYDQVNDIERIDDDYGRVGRDGAV